MTQSSTERLLARWFGSAGAPAQLMHQEQRSRQALHALGSGPGTLALQGWGSVERLLQSPLAEAGADQVLNKVLQHRAQARAQSTAPPSAPALARALASAAAEPPAATGRQLMNSAAIGPQVMNTAVMGRQVMNSASMAGLTAQNLANAGPAFKSRSGRTTPPAAGLAGQAARFDSAAAATRAWQQRTARAGLAQAFATPLHLGTTAPRNTFNAPGLAALFGPALGAAVAAVPAFRPGAERARPVPAGSTSLVGAGPLQAWASVFQPALPLLSAALNELELGSAAATQARSDATPPRRRPRNEPLPGSGSALLPALAAPMTAAGTAVASTLQATTAVLPMADAGFGALSGVPTHAPSGAFASTAAQGLRGLAASASATSAPAGAPALAPPARNPGATSDDETLTEQLTRVLKREAQRDGIDISELQP